MICSEKALGPFAATCIGAVPYASVLSRDLSRLSREAGYLCPYAKRASSPAVPKRPSHAPDATLVPLQANGSGLLQFITTDANEPVADIHDRMPDPGTMIHLLSRQSKLQRVRRQTSGS